MPLHQLKSFSIPSVEPCPTVACALDTAVYDKKSAVGEVLLASVLNNRKASSDTVRADVYGTKWKAAIKLPTERIPHEQIVTPGTARTSVNHKVTGEVDSAVRIIRRILKATDVCARVLLRIAEIRSLRFATVHVGNGIILEGW